MRVDVRVIAATNCDLVRRVEQGRFREDLFYRLNVVPIRMPSLRERPEDIPLLAEHFVEKICAAEGVPLKRLTPDAASRLYLHCWPGNVRELENAVEMAVVLSGDHSWLTAGDFPDPARTSPRPFSPAVQQRIISVPDGGLDYEETIASIQRSILQQALEKTGGNKKAAARMLRLKRTTLSAKIRTLESTPAQAV
jgi:DNA-binding NtrC family response regulator